MILFLSVMEEKSRKKKGTKDAYQEDYACEVTIPINE